MIVVTEFFIENFQESFSLVVLFKGGQPVNYICSKPLRTWKQQNI